MKIKSVLNRVSAVCLLVLPISVSECMPQPRKAATMRYTMEIGAIDPDDVDHAAATAEILKERIALITRKGFTFGSTSNTTCHAEFETAMLPGAVELLLTATGKVGFYELYAPGELPQIAESVSGSLNTAGTELPGLDEGLKEYIASFPADTDAFCYSFSREQDADNARKYLRAMVRNGLLPENTHIFRSIPGKNVAVFSHEIYIVKLDAALDGPVIDQRYIEDAEAHAKRGFNELEMKFDPQGAVLWEKVTGDNIGKRLAIVIDEEVVSAPKVMMKIKGNWISLSADFDYDTFAAWAVMLKTGPLKLPVELQETGE